MVINVVGASMAGMEWDVQYAWTETVDTGFSYTYNDSRDLRTDQQLPMRPDHTTRIRGQQKLQSFPVTLWSEAIIRSSTWNDGAHTLSIAGSVQINAAICYSFSPEAQVYLRAENLTNNRISRYSAPIRLALWYRVVFNWSFSVPTAYES